MTKIEHKLSPGTVIGVEVGDLPGLREAVERLTVENEKMRAGQVKAERTIRDWHKAALAMRDLAIGGDCKGVEQLYFDTAMRLPFYGADQDPLPCEAYQQTTQQKE